MARVLNAMRNHPGFALMIGISPYAREPEHDEDGLDREETHDVSEHDDGEHALHMPRFRSKAEIQRHIQCLRHEIEYFEALLRDDQRAASKAREHLNSAMSDGDDDER
jgi:hypothetical protein